MEDIFYILEQNEPTEMDVSQAASIFEKDYESMLIKHVTRNEYIPCLPQLWLGAPGLGKTALVNALAENLAKKMGKTFVKSLHLNLQNKDLVKDVFDENNKGKYFLLVEIDLAKMEPGDFQIPDVTSDGFKRLGIDEKDQDRYRLLGFANFTKMPVGLLALSLHPGILFIDEITNVQRSDLINTIYKIINENKIGDIPFHPFVTSILAGNRGQDSNAVNTSSVTAPMSNRVQTIQVTAPTSEAWFEYISKKYQHLPSYMLGFLSSYSQFIDAVPVSRIEELPEEKRFFTSPRSLELFVSKLDNLYVEYYKYGYDKKMSFESYVSQAIADKRLGSIICSTHLKEFRVFVQEISRMKELIDEGKVTRGNRSLQIACLTFFGDMIKNYALQSQTAQQKKQVYQLYSYKDLQEYTNKVLNNLPTELYNFLLLGAGISNKKTQLTDMLYVISYMIGMLSGKDQQECEKFSQTYNISLYDFFKEFIVNKENLFQQKINELRNDISNLKTNNQVVLNRLFNLFISYFNIVNTKFVNLLQDYLMFDQNSEQAQKIEPMLKVFVGDIDFKQLKNLIENYQLSDTGKDDRNLKLVEQLDDIFSKVKFGKSEKSSQSQNKRANVIQQR